MRTAVARLSQLPVLALAVAVVVGFAISTSFLSFTAVNPRWAVYSLFGPVCALVLVNIRNKYVWLTVLFGVLMLIEGTIVSTRQFAGVWIGISTPLLVLAFLTQRETRPEKIGWGVNIWLWITFLVAAIAATTRSHDSGEVESRLFQQLYFQGIFYFVLGAVWWRRVSDLKHLYWMLASVCVALFGTQIWFELTGVAVVGNRLENVSPDVVWRFGSAFGNPNSLAIFYAVSLPGFIIMSLGRSNSSGRWLFRALSGMALLGVVLTGSRGGTLTAIFSVVMALAAGTDSRRFSLPARMGFGASIASVAWAVVSYFPWVIERFTKRWADKGLEDVRFEIWGAMAELLFDKPFGVGISPTSFLLELNRLESHLFIASPHNVLLGIAASVGLIGVFAFLLIVLRPLLAVTSKAWRRTHEKYGAIVLAPYISLGAWFVGGMTEPIFHNGYKLSCLMWFLVGTLAWLASRAAYEFAEESSASPP